MTKQTQIGEALKAAKAASKCPSCGHNVRVLLEGAEGSGDAMVLGLNAKQHAGERNQRSLQVIPLMCANCGYISLHSLERLLAVKSPDEQANVPAKQ